jgi:hypothetical protein
MDMPLFAAGGPGQALKHFPAIFVADRSRKCDRTMIVGTDYQSMANFAEIEQAKPKIGCFCDPATYL